MIGLVLSSLHADKEKEDTNRMRTAGLREARQTSASSESQTYTTTLQYRRNFIYSDRKNTAWTLSKMMSK